MIKKPFYCAILCLCFGLVKSQTIERQVIASGGDYFKTPSFSLSWTLGEPITETFKNNDITLTQGFQQSEFKITAIREPLAEQFDINVFPNPTVDVLNIKINSSKDEIITVQLYSMTGEKILSEKTQEKNIQLNLTNLSSASYLLSLRKFDGELITTYVINKSR